MMEKRNGGAIEENGLAKSGSASVHGALYAEERNGVIEENGLAKSRAASVYAC